MMSCCSSERRSARMHVHGHGYFRQNPRAPAGIDGRRNDDVSAEVLLGLPVLALTLEHLAEIDVRQDPIALIPRVGAQIGMGAPPNPLPQLRELHGFDIPHPALI